MLKIFDLVPSWVYAAAIAALLVVAGLQRIETANLEVRLATAKKEISEQRESYQAVLNAEIEKSRAKERTLNDKIAKTQEAKNAEINTLRTDVRDLRGRLSYLSTRPTSTPGGEAATFAQAPAGCPGPVLYRDTAEALADEAERADLIRIELRACYRQWDQAVEVMEK